MVQLVKYFEHDVWVHLNTILVSPIVDAEIAVYTTLTREGSADTYSIDTIFVATQSERYTMLRFPADSLTDVPAGVYQMVLYQKYIVGEQKPLKVLQAHVMESTEEENRPYVLDMDQYTTYEG